MEDGKEKDVTDQVETKEFNPSNFRSTPGNGLVEDKTEEKTETTETKTEETTEAKTEETTETKSTEEKTDEGDYSFSWDKAADEKKPEEEQEEKKPEETTESKETTEEKPEVEDKTEKKEEAPQFDGSLTDDHYQAFAKELGLEATNLDELKKTLEDVVAENDRLRSGDGNVTNDVIQKLQDYKKLDNLALVTEDLKGQGFKDDQLQDAIDKLQDNGLLDIEAQKIKNAIDRRINAERDSLTAESRQADAKQQEARKENVKKLRTYLDNTDEMFGFKMASNEESLAEVRKSHQEYITSGTYLKEITKDEQSLAESSFLWKNRDVLFKALKNSGLQQGKSEILNDLGNPNNDTTQRFTSPEGKGEFDPGKFRSRPKRKN